MSQIEHNTTELEEILDTINNLPEVSSGENTKEEQEKTVTINQNGTTEVIPDNGKTLSKVTINTNVVGGSGGSGIIDVTELPTSGIDENAVYRVTESVQTEKTEVYIKPSSSTAYTLQQYLVSIGVPTTANLYEADELSNMLETDVQTFSKVNIYILKSDGIAYANVPAYGGVITIGLFSFQAMGYDKGFTKDISAETESGVYTTIEAFKEVIRYFIRENGEWKEITAYVRLLTPHGLEYPDFVTGDLTSRVFSGVDVVSGECTEIDENWFIKRDGTYYTVMKPSLFYQSKMETATIPHFITNVGTECFIRSYNLKTVTFKGNPSLGLFPFDECFNLTTINVPWSEGEVSGAPWGATNATINYNYTGE